MKRKKLVCWGKAQLYCFHHLLRKYLSLDAEFYRTQEVKLPALNDKNARLLHY